MSTLAVRMRTSPVRTILFVLLSMLVLPVHAEVFSAAAVKAAFLYRFASYVEWPEDAPAGPLVIAVAGADEVAGQLDELLPRVNGSSRAVAVRRVSKPGELDGVHILYVGPDSLGRTRALRTAALNRPILLVTDDQRGLDSGGVINFVEAERNVRFEISLLAADRARLKINSALLSVAARVERRPQAWTNCADPYMRRYRPAACVIRTAALNGGTLR